MGRDSRTNACVWLSWMSSPEAARTRRLRIAEQTEPAAEVSCLAAQSDCQLYSARFVRPAVAGRPPLLPFAALNRSTAMQWLLPMATGLRTRALGPIAVIGCNCGAPTIGRLPRHC
jgi:hypothetical protein